MNIYEARWKALEHDLFSCRGNAYENKQNTLIAMYEMFILKMKNIEYEYPEQNPQES